MRRLSVALLGLSIALAALTSTALAGSVPQLVTRQLRFCTWGDAGAQDFADTTYLGANASNGITAMDTTEALPTWNLSWFGQGSVTGVSAAIAYARVHIGVRFCDSNADSLMYCVEQSVDGRLWSTYPGSAKAATGWTTVKAVGATSAALYTTSFAGTAFTFPLTMMNGVSVPCYTAGYEWGAPYIRLRLRSSVGANDKISGVKVWISYYQFTD